MKTMDKDDFFLITKRCWNLKGFSFNRTLSSEDRGDLYNTYFKIAENAGYDSYIYVRALVKYQDIFLNPVEYMNRTR